MKYVFCSGKRLVYKPYAQALKGAIHDAERVFTRFPHGYQPLHASGLFVAFRVGNLVVA